MKISKTLFTILTLLCSLTLFSQELTVASFNIRFETDRDTGNLWKDRRPFVNSLIRFHDFDIFGIQEGLLNQLDDISAGLPAYSRWGKGRDDGGTKGEHAAVFYKKERFTRLNQGDFWLSETPDRPSLGWDATCCNRICSWVYLQDKKSGRKFYFFNVHFDHQGVEARKESSKLILKKISEIAGNEPTILTGDLNGSHTSEWYLTLANSGVLKDTYTQVQFPYANNASFNGFTGTKGNNDIIDHIFTTRHFSVQRWGLLTDTYHGKYPSDHFPVMADLKFE